ncbi:LysM peptidoglycan-binding domain-containing protein [Arthrobacter sp. SX1312]|uniref:LysM peptidoglycan-binding domain-containing protein n=1 Tax=Arthrobacter sp. SX1312 TaxID=2058896 RepID=UPI0015E23DB1|nr:LysM domain-containing protein [Arthrobacter sp. SX1312]
MRTSDTIQAGMILGCGIACSGAGAALLVGGPAPGGPDLEGVLGAALSGIGLAVVGVWVLLFVVAVLAELLKRRGPSAMAALASRCAPAMMRRLAAALLGANLLAVPAVAPAAAGGSEHVLTATAARSSAPAVHGGLSPVDAGPADRVPPMGSSDAGRQNPRHGAEPPAPATPSGSPDAAPAPVSPAWEPLPMQVDGGPLLRGESRTVVGGEEIVVAPGDSLWSIVAARLGPLATASDIAEAWPLWYATNRAVVGDDPSLLLPGTVLQAPTGS